MVGSPGWVPTRGDVVWVTLDPRSGNEQGGRRPALVLSPTEYNRKTGLMICCPVTSRQKGYPFEVPLTESDCVHGVILSDHIHSLDWRGRRAERIGTVARERIEATLARLMALIDPTDVGQPSRDDLGP